MNAATPLTRLVYTLFLSLSLFSLSLIAWPGQLAQADSPTITPPAATNAVTGQEDTTPPVFTGTVLLAPADGLTLTIAFPTFDWADATDAEGGVISYTLALTGPTPTDFQLITTTESGYTPTLPLANGPYTWTVQAYDTAGNATDFVMPYTFTVDVTPTEVVTWLLYLPLLLKPDPTPTCPTSSSASFDLIPIQGSSTDHPDYLHGDLNLSLRGYSPTSAYLGLVSYNGSTDSNAPQLAGLFEPNRFPGVNSVYRVNSWNWLCGPHGCSGPAITTFPVTLAGLTTTSGQAISIPERSPNIYSGSFKAMVLYAEERRITLGYTREDTVANGYAVHIENVCVDPNLLALYRSQITSDGWRKTGKLPALRNNQPFGTALNTEILVAIRDRGSFMDPRSRKDWWPGY
jgi:hypothetical protein